MQEMGQGRFGWLVRDPRGRLKRLRLRLTVIPPRTALQKRQMLKRPELSPSARELLQRTDSRLHPYEDMYTGDGFPYFWAGLVGLWYVVTLVGVGDGGVGRRGRSFAGRWSSGRSST
jgi:hypothetical protein